MVFRWLLYNYLIKMAINFNKENVLLVFMKIEGRNK